MNTAAKLNSQLLLASASGAVLESVTEVADENNLHRSYFVERQTRLHRLSERLGISPEQPDDKQWMLIGIKLAQREREFGGDSTAKDNASFFPTFPDALPNGRGRPKERVMRDAILAEKVDKHLRANPGLKTLKAAVQDMIDAEIIPKKGSLESRMKSVERGNRAWRKYAERVTANLMEAEREVAKPTKALRRRARPDR